MQRQYGKPHSFKDRLVAVLDETRAKAIRLKPGPKQDALLNKVRQLETAIDMNDYLTGSNLRTTRVTDEENACLGPQAEA